MKAGRERKAEDRGWMNLDLSRLGEFEPYDFGGLDPEHLGLAIQWLPDGTFQVEAEP